MTNAPRPPLTRRMRPGHWIALDCAVGTVAGLIIAFSAAGAARAPFDPLPVLLVLLLAAATGVPVAFRRRGPVPALCVLLGLAVVTFPFEGWDLAGSVLLAASYPLHTVTVTVSKRTGIAALLLSLALTAVLAIVGRTHPDGYLGHNDATGMVVPVVFAMVIAWVIGYSARQRRQYALMLQQQAASSAVAAERLRIARELHDIVAHSMSVIAVQAGYGQYVIGTSPPRAREALGAIQATSRDALEEMRRMLGVLRQQDAEASAASAAASPVPPAPAGPVPAPSAPVVPGPPVMPDSLSPSGSLAPPRAPLAPEPGLADLDRLVQRTSLAGVRVSLERLGPVRDVPAGIGVSAYRIIQEALTNVVKHAGIQARCTVRISYADESLGISVTDDGGHSVPAADDGSCAFLPDSAIGTGFSTTQARLSAAAVTGTRHGIIGMRERASLCGGAVKVGPAPGGGFQVTAMLPLRQAATATGGDRR